MMKRKVILLILLLSIIPSISRSTAAAYSQEQVIPHELQVFFSSYDINHDGNLTLAGAMKFYNWTEVQIMYRYDDENDQDGQWALATGAITQEQLGDGRYGADYWQMPNETYYERYGDCEDMAILELAFYTYFGIESYMGLVDVDGDGQVDHAICIVLLDEESFDQLVEYQGIVDYYELDGGKFVIVDNAYSDAYGFVGSKDPITGEPVPNEDVDFTMYETMTLQQLYDEYWSGYQYGGQNENQNDYSLLIDIIVPAILAVASIISYLLVQRKRLAERTN